MLELFAPVKVLLEKEPVRTENFAFRLHCRGTVLVLVVCTILVTAKQYIGEPISCITDTTIDRDSVNAYCWIYGTFTVPRHLGGMPGRSVASAGVGPAAVDEETYRHRYYQWVCFVLGLQAILFYAPRALWSLWEKGTVAFLAEDLSPRTLGETSTEKRSRRTAEFFARKNNRDRNFYAIRFSLCELINFLGTVGQIYALDAFLEGEFHEYGLTVLAFASGSEPRSGADPMARLFPKVAKCTIHKFGPAGSVQIHDALCVLPLNIINEKIFVFLWFWLMFLAGVGLLALAYRVIVFSQSWARVYILRADARSLSQTKASDLVRALCYGDWFLLHRLAQNVNPTVFTELVDELVLSCSPKQPGEQYV